MNLLFFIVLFLPVFGIAHLMKCTPKTIIDDNRLNSVFEARGERIIECLNETPCTTNCTIEDYESSPPAYKPTCEKFLFSSLSAVDEFADVGISCPLKAPLNYNITFWNITWRKVFVRSRLRGGDGGGAWCLALEAPNGFAPGAAVAVAQRQWTDDAAGSTAELELLALGAENDRSAARYARFLYKVPRGGWEPLVALEVSRLPWVGVVWAQLPARFNVTHYLVEMDGRSSVRVDDSGCTRGFCRVRVRVGLRRGATAARVRPVHPSCAAPAAPADPAADRPRCLWEAPACALRFAVPWFVWLVAVLLSGLLVMYFALVIHSLCCKAPGEPVRVLYLFDAVDPRHTRAARILNEYLRNAANIECLYEAEEVPKSPSKNASQWLRATLAEAPLVLLLASPESLSPIRFSPYPDVFGEALGLLEGRSRGVLVALPPYVALRDLPAPLRSCPSFRLPAHTDLLIWSVYNPRAARTPLALLALCWLRAAASFGGGCGERRLREAWEEARAEQLIKDWMPPTPDPSGYSVRTKGGVEGSASWSIAVPCDFPGDLHALPLGPLGPLVPLAPPGESATQTET